jgi:hypothetical protein
MDRVVIEELGELTVHISGAAWRLHDSLEVSRGSSKVVWADDEPEDVVNAPGVRDCNWMGCGAVR